MTNTQGQLRAGFGIGSAADAVLASVLLVLLVPTNEYRARLWFLLATSGSDVSLEAALWGAFWLAGTLPLLVVRRLKARSIVGTALAAAVYVAGLKAGAWKWLPEFTSFSLRFVHHGLDRRPRCVASLANASTLASIGGRWCLT